MTDVDERHVLTYHAGMRPAHLLTADRSRQLTPRELVYVLLSGFGSPTPEYVHAMARLDLPASIR